MVMLDTNILVYAIRHPYSELKQRFRKYLGGELCISSVTYMELVDGVKRSRDVRRNDEALREILAGIHIIPFDAYAAEHAGDIMAFLCLNGMRIGEKDTMIAGHARSLGLELVTNNTREFERVPGLEIEDWLER